MAIDQNRNRGSTGSREQKQKQQTAREDRSSRSGSQELSRSSPGSGMRGGSREQHSKAGKQSHKNN